MDNVALSLWLGIGTALVTAGIIYIIIKKLWPQKSHIAPKYTGLRWALCVWALGSGIPLGKIIIPLLIGGDAKEPLIKYIVGIATLCSVAYVLGYIWAKLKIGKATFTAVNTVSQTIKNTTESFSARDSVWWYAINGERKGTISRDDLKDLFTQNQITPETLVWKEGMNNWEKIADISSLSSLLSSAPPPLPYPNSPSPLPSDFAEEDQSLENAQTSYVVNNSQKRNNYFFLIGIVVLAIMSLAAFGIVNSTPKSSTTTKLSLAQGYFLGAPSPQISYSEAIKALLESLEESKSDIEDSLSIHIINSAFKTGRIAEEDYKRTIPLIIKLADNGNVAAQTKSGELFEEGKYVKGDKTLAESYYLKAAEQGSGAARLKLASLYIDNRDYVSAYRWTSIDKEASLTDLQKNNRSNSATEESKTFIAETIKMSIAYDTKQIKTLKNILTKSQIREADIQVQKWKETHPKQFNNPPPNTQ